MITMPCAARLTGLNETILKEWINMKMLHHILLPSGEIRVCCESLSQTTAQHKKSNDGASS